MKYIDLRIGKIESYKDNLIYIRHKKISNFPTFDEIKEMVDELLKLANHQPFYLITDFSDVFQNWDSESKEYIANHPELNKLKIAHAIVVNTLPTKLLINLFMSFNKPPGETKIFNNMKEAENWIENIKE